MGDQFGNLFVLWSARDKRIITLDHISCISNVQRWRFFSESKKISKIFTAFNSRFSKFICYLVHIINSKNHQQFSVNLIQWNISSKKANPKCSVETCFHMNLRCLYRFDNAEPWYRSNVVSWRDREVKGKLNLLNWIC